MATNYTTEDVQALEQALASGVLRVTHNGVTTEFQSRDDMLRQVNLMKGELAAAATVRPKIRRLRFLSQKGLGRF